MAKRIITISREYGSGGRFIGEEVARKLGIAYYDKDIIGQIAEQSGLSPEYIKENAELSPKKGLFAYAFAGRDITGKSIEDIVYEAQRKVILELAGKEPCEIMSSVIVKENETLDSALRRFKRNCAKAGIQQEIRKREHYEKPSVKRKKKSEAARKRKYN